MPTLPTVAIRLLELYDDPDADLGQIVELLQTDPAITAKIVKAANSSAFGIGREVSSLHQAVLMLGKAVVAPLALSFTLSEKSMRSNEAAEMFQKYWLQAIVQAITAECLAKKYAKKQAGEWFVVGLLSSIGRLALINHDPKTYQQVLDEAEANRTFLHETEQAHLETTTVDLSAELLQEWKLPQRWVDATANQIRLVEELEGLPAQGIPHAQLFVGAATAAAVGSYFCQSCQGEALVRIVHLMEEGFGASEEDVTKLIESVRERLDAVSHLFQIQCATQGSPTELMSAAMQHLASLAVQNAVTNTGPAASAGRNGQNGCLLERIERLTRRSTTDTLTGTYNRGYFDDRLNEEVGAMMSASRGLGVVFIDVDHFKSVNDTHGHAAGDEVLRQVAQVLGGTLRSSDVLARYGGEEFVVMVTNPSIEEMTGLGERLRSLIEQKTFVYQEISIPVTISVGVAIGQPDAEMDGFAERLIASADKAMYEAKRGGRNRVVVANSQSPSNAPVAVQ